MKRQKIGCQLPDQNFILAKNWDRTGARVHAILNGYIVAKALNIDFRFIWPDDHRCREMNDYIKIFSDEFVSKHRLFEEDLSDWQERAIPEAKGQTVEEYRHEISIIPEQHYLHYHSIFKIPQFANFETNQLFSELADHIFSAEVLEINQRVQNCAQKLKNYKILHLRYGDILNGSFRHYPDIYKYLPYCVVCDLLLNSDFKGSVVFISDTPEVANSLSSLNHNWYTAEQLNIIDDSSDEFQTIFRDLFLMRFADQVLAASLSAFSQFGAHLGEKEVESVGVGKQIEDISKLLKWMIDHNLYDDIPAELTGVLFARDITQLMNTHSRSLNLDQWSEVALKAAKSDPEYVVAAAQLATVYTFQDQPANAIRCLNQVRPHAEEARETHDDPLVYLTVVETFLLFVQTVSAIKSGKSAEARLLFDQTTTLVQFLRSLTPFQIPLPTLLDSLEKSLSVLQEEIEFLESISAVQKKLFCIKHHAIIRKIFKKPVKYLDPLDLYKSIYCNVEEDEFLLSLTQTISKLCNSFKASNE